MTRPLRGLGTTICPDTAHGVPTGGHSHQGCDSDGSPWWISTWDVTPGHAPPGHDGAKAMASIQLYLTRRGSVSWMAQGKDQRQALANCCRKVRRDLARNDVVTALRLAGVLP